MKANTRHFCDDVEIFCNICMTLMCASVSPVFCMVTQWGGKWTICSQGRLRDIDMNVASLSEPGWVIEKRLCDGVSIPHRCRGDWPCPFLDWSSGGESSKKPREATKETANQSLKSS